MNPVNYDFTNNFEKKNGKVILQFNCEINLLKNDVIRNDVFFMTSFNVLEFSFGIKCLDFDFIIVL